ncbi:thiaminase II/PqqC family protein [Staphylococcus aureus]
MLEVIFYFRQDFLQWNFHKNWYQAAKPIINNVFMRHDFIQKMLLGNIQADALRHYLQADAAYLKEFTNLYALLIPKMKQHG